MTAYPMKLDGLRDSWKGNVRLIRPQRQKCLKQFALWNAPTAATILKYHADKYNCEVDRGDGYRIGSAHS